MRTIPPCFLFSLALATLVWASTSKICGAILSGSVSFDSGSGLYTYNYSIANGFEVYPITGFPYDIVELNILVNSASSASVPGPTAHTDAGWSFNSPITTAGSPANEFGRSWDWSGFSLGVPPYENGVPSNTSKSGFSFTTDRAPSSGSGNNYFLYGLTIAGGFPVGSTGTIVEYGRVVAPDFLISAPEPSTLALLALGAVGLLLRCRR